LQSYILIINFNIKVYIIQSIPLVRSWFNFDIQSMLQFFINSAFFCNIPVISAINYKIINILNTVIFSYIFDFGVNNFSNFYEKDFTETFYIFFWRQIYSFFFQKSF